MISTWRKKIVTGATVAALAVASSVLPASTVASANTDACANRTVVLLHGTWSDASVWDKWIDPLTKSGWCTVAMNYGQDDSVTAAKLRPNTFGVAPVMKSAEEVEGKISDLVAKRGKVALITHSQGGLVARVIGLHGGGDLFDTVVTIASTAHGTIGTGATDAARMLGWNGDMGDLAGVVGQSAVDQLDGSALMKSLADKPDTVKGVRYLSIITSDDIVATPAPVAGFLHKQSDNAVVWNVDVRDCMAKDAPATGHSGIVDAPQTLSLAMWAISHGNGKPRCNR